MTPEEALTVIVRAIMGTTVAHRGTRARRRSAARDAAAPNPPRQMPLPINAPGAPAEMPSPPFTQADYERMERTLAGEAAQGYYQPHEGSGAGDGVS